MLIFCFRTEPRRTTTWHVNPDVVPVDGLDLLPDGETLAGSGQAEAQHLSSIAAQRVWEELYVAKEPAVEESLRVAIGANTQNRAPVLADLPNSVGPSAPKLWLNYVEAERRSTYLNLFRLLEENDKISHLFRCAKVQGLETVDGLLLFGKEHLYVVDGFTQVCHCFVLFTVDYR